MLKNLLSQSSRFIAQQADKTFVEYFIKGKRPGRGERPMVSQSKAIEIIERLEAIAEDYVVEKWPDDQLFVTPDIPRVHSAPQHGPKQAMKLFGANLSVDHLTWQSTFTCRQDAFARGYDTDANRKVHMRLFHKTGAPRPVAMLIHGYRGGVLSLEERIWPIKMFTEAGFDVALFVLPHHGPRLPSLNAAPMYPARDVRLTIEGMRQSVEDIRAGMRILELRGHPSIGACGMSLGGYVTSLLTTVEDALAFSVPMIPLASFAQWAKEADTLVGQDDATRQRHQAAIDALCHTINPLARPSKIPSDHILVVGGQVDAVTPLEHARKLASHFQSPLETFGGGHVLQVGRRAAFKRALDIMQYATH